MDSRALVELLTYDSALITSHYSVSQTKYGICSFARNHTPRGYAVWDALRPLETQSVSNGIPPETGGTSSTYAIISPTAPLGCASGSQIHLDGVKIKAPAAHRRGRRSVVIEGDCLFWPTAPENGCCR